MPSLPCIRDTLVLGLLLAPHAASQEPAFTTERYPYNALQTPGDERWLTGRIVDGLTGQAIPAAEVLLIGESAHPMRGEFWSQMRGVADADGFVHMRVDAGAQGYEKWHWVCVRAKGYGPRVAMGSFENAIVRLNPAVTLPVQVLDWLDRPVADALVGFCGGCGHTPDLVHGRTNALGVVQLPDVDLFGGFADLYVEHPELALGYDSVWWVPGEGPAALRVGPGMASIGNLFDELGKPIAGAYVGCMGVHRGPWTRTAADGSFRLYGCDWAADVLVHHGGRVLLFQRPPTQPFRLQMPKPDGNETQIVYLTDKARAIRDAEPAAAAELPTVMVQTVGLPEDGEVWLRTRSGKQEITGLVVAGQPVAVPDVPFAFLLEVSQSASRVFVYDQRRALAEKVVQLSWFQPTRVNGNVVSSKGTALAVQIAIHRRSMVRSADGVFDSHLDWRDYSGAFSAPTHMERTCLLFLRDKAGELPMRMVPILLPRRGDNASLDVGTIVMSEAPQLTLLRPDGELLVDTTVTLTRTGWEDLAHGRAYPVDQAGRCYLPDLRAGDGILVRSRSVPVTDGDAVNVIDLPSRFVLSGEGPWVLRQHGGELLLDVRTANATKRSPAVTIGDRLVHLHGRTILRGLAPGSHELFLAAPEHQSARVRVTVEASGGQPVRVTLPAR
ncbi:MAG: hypothetical protein ACI91B_002235 [Planctomycetota bacterium]|jgi:hypothetical protein